ERPEGCGRGATGFAAVGLLDCDPVGALVGRAGYPAGGDADLGRIDQTGERAVEHPRPGEPGAAGEAASGTAVDLYLERVGQRAGHVVGDEVHVTRPGRTGVPDLQAPGHRPPRRQLGVGEQRLVAVVVGERDGGELRGRHSPVGPQIRRGRCASCTAPRARWCSGCCCAACCRCSSAEPRPWCSPARWRPPCGPATWSSPPQYRRRGSARWLPVRWFWCTTRRTRAACCCTASSGSTRTVP